MAFEEGEEQFLLATVVLLDVEQRIELGARAIARLGECIGPGGVREPVDRRAQLADGLAQGLVLALERVDRMPGHDARPNLHRRHRVAHHLGVQVAHRADLVDAHPVCHQLLFHGRDFGRVHLVHERRQALTHLVGRASLVQVQDDVLQGGNALGAVVDQFAHRGCLGPVTRRYAAVNRHSHDRTRHRPAV